MHIVANAPVTLGLQAAEAAGMAAAVTLGLEEKGLAGEGLILRPSSQGMDSDYEIARQLQQEEDVLRMVNAPNPSSFAVSS